MKMLYIKPFQVNGVQIPGFYVGPKKPTSIIWPVIGERTALYEVAKIISNQDDSRKTCLVAPMIKFSYIWRNRTVGDFLKRNSYEKIYLHERLNKSRDYKLYLLGAAQKLLVNLALKSNKNDIMIFSTDALDPKGCQMIIEYSYLLSEKVYVIHVEFPSNIPNTFSEWQTIHGLKPN